MAPGRIRWPVRTRTRGVHHKRRWVWCRARTDRWVVRRWIWAPRWGRTWCRGIKGGGRHLSNRATPVTARHQDRGRIRVGVHPQHRKGHRRSGGVITPDRPSSRGMVRTVSLFITVLEYGWNTLVYIDLYVGAGTGNGAASWNSWNMPQNNQSTGPSGKSLIC